MPKNIVVFSDGTGQEGGIGNNTNVYQLYNLVLDRSLDQIAFYDRGIGTGWRKLTSNIGGSGISKNLLECYQFIFDNFETGDQIYLFGFSRGAATVRSLSSFIHMFGMLPKSRPELIEQAYKIYKTRNKMSRKLKAKEFLSRHHNMWCKIQFIGVWDTVAALGVPFKVLDSVLDRIPLFKHKFQTFDLSSSVIHARHALSIDDERRTFHPTFWTADISEKQTMKQVWFCGVHTDVGGGYKNQDLAKIPMEWMVNEAIDKGLKIYDPSALKFEGDVNGKMHDSRKGLGWFYFRKVRSWPTKTHGQPCIHSSVEDRIASTKNEPKGPYEPWILNDDYKYTTEK